MADPDDAVPKLPRGRGLKLSGAEVFRIIMTAGLLVALIALTKPCSRSVSTFVTGFGSGAGSAKGSAGSAKIDPYEHLTPNMSDAEVRAAIERSKIKNANGQGPEATGSAGAGLAGSAAPAAPATPATPATPAIRAMRRELVPIAPAPPAPR